MEEFDVDEELSKINNQIAAIEAQLDYSFNPDLSSFLDDLIERREELLLMDDNLEIEDDLF